MDEETETDKLVKKFGVSVVLLIIISTLSIIFILNKFTYKEPSIIKKVNNKETFIILVKNSKCQKCSKLKELISDTNYSYTELNKEDTTRYNKTIKKLNLSVDDITVPTIIYVKKGKTYSFLVDASMDDFKEYLDNLKDVGD